MYACASTALVETEGYVMEEHTVQTADGYLLNIYRLPCAKAGCTSVLDGHR